MLFFDSQREGNLPLSTSAAVPWRGPAFTADYNTTVTLASSLPNGTLDGFGVRAAGSSSRRGWLHKNTEAGLVANSAFGGIFYLPWCT